MVFRCKAGRLWADVMILIRDLAFPLGTSKRKIVSVFFGVATRVGIVCETQPA